MGDGKVSSGLSQVWGNIVRSVTGKLPEIAGEAKEAVDALEKLVTDSGAKSLATRGMERLGGYVHDGMEAVSDAVDTGAKAVSQAVDAGAKAVTEAVDAGAKAVDQAVDAAAETGKHLATDAADALQAASNDVLPVSFNDMRIIGGNVLKFLETGKLSAEQQFILSKLTPDASMSLSKLSAGDIGKFLKVASAVMLEDGARRLKGESGLLLLLVRGDLTKEPPGGGPRLLDTLADRAFKPLDPQLAKRGMTMGEALTDVIEVAAMPVIVRQGRGSSTCVAGSLQAAKAAEDPAGYAEMALSLVQDGHATVKGADGTSHEIQLDTSDIDDGHKGQDILDAALQGSLVAFAKQAVPEGGEGDDFGGGRAGSGGRMGGGRVGSGGRFGGGRLGSGGRFGGGRAGGGGRMGGDSDDGLTLPQASFLYETALGRKGSAVNVADENSEAVTKAIENVAGTSPVQVGLQAVQADGSMGGHMMSVQGASTDANGNSVILVSDSLDGEITAMPREEFKKLLIGAILPDQP